MTEQSKLQSYSIPPNPLDLVEPDIGDRHAFVETRLGRMVRHARFFFDDRDTEAFHQYQSEIVALLVNDGLSEDDADMAFDVLLKYAPVEAEIHGGSFEKPKG